MGPGQVKPFYISLRPFLDHHVLSRPVDWQKIFGNDRPLEVEIGFGNGEYLARLGEQDQGVNFVGFEEYCERISRTLRKLSRVKSENVRVMRLDVRPGFSYLFAPQSIKTIHCLYPPPWPKKSDIKHRLMNTEFLRLANSRLVEHGTMKVVTDHKPYVAWMQEQVPDTGFSCELSIIPASFDTKFERKWVEGGQKEFYQLLLSKKAHYSVPVKEGRDLQQYTVDGFDPEHFQMFDYSDGNKAVAFKDYLYDPKRQVAQVQLLVHDEHLLQSVRVLISKHQTGWRVGLAQGSMLMPTPGIAQALECVRDAAMRGASGRKS
jgi:tRNA (guanine-N7-)-methyltransferase